MFILKDMCGKDRCKCQKNNCFTPKQFQMKGKGSKDTMEKTFKGSQTALGITF